MDADITILALRLGFTALLYLFLLAIGLIVYRELKVAAVRPQRQPRITQDSLVVIDAGETGLLPGQAFELQPITSLGRDPANTVVLPDAFASANHALVAWRDDRWWIEDLGSTNGTLLNRRLVKKPTQLNYGDIIQVGRVKLKLAR